MTYFEMDLIPAEVAAQAIAGIGGELASQITHAAYGDRADDPFAERAHDCIANIRAKLYLIETALTNRGQPAPVKETPAHPDLDLAWARVNVLGGSGGGEYNEAISDVLILLTKLGATTAVWDAGG